MANTSRTSPPRRRTQAERRERAESELLSAALRLIAEKGVSRTTLAEIGEAAGYSRALPAVYFGDKTKLVQALWKHVLRLFKARMERMTEREEGLAAVTGLISVYLTRTEKDPYVFRATQVLLAEAFTAAPEIRDSVAQNNRDSEEFLRKHIKLGIKNGEIRSDVDAAAQSIIILAGLRGVVSHWIINSEVNLLALRKEFLRSTRQSLST